MAKRTRLWLALLAGSLLFVLNNTAVWSAWLHPPQGYEPLFLVRSQDMAEYLTYLVLANDPTWTSPDLHAPWTMPGGLFHPLVLVVGRAGHLLGLSPALAFQVGYFLSCIGGAWVLLYALEFFVPTIRQRWWTLAAVVASVPLALLAILTKPVKALPPEFYGLGMVQFAYNSADGLFRGGLSNSFTIAWGSSAMLLALTFTAKRIVTGEVRYRYFAAGTIFLSAFLHPFEYFVMVPASGVALLWAAKRSGMWKDAVGDFAWNAGSAITGLLPTLYLAFRYKWISDLSTICSERMYPTWLLATYGLPCILVIYCLLLRYRPASASDQVLIIWFISTAVIVCLPYCPYPPHLLNGFTYVTAMLLVRLLFEHRQTKALYQSRPRLVLGLSSAAVALSLIAMATLHVQLWKDGRAKEPDLLLTAVTTPQERAIVDWMRGRVNRDDLVLAPPDLAPWLAPAPVHVFASHVMTGFNYPQQLELTNAFYQGESRDKAQALLNGYGIHWVVAPAGSPATHYFSDPPAGRVGDLVVYEIPGNRMAPYPGLARLVPGAEDAKSLSRVVMDATAKMMDLLRGKKAS